MSRLRPALSRLWADGKAYWKYAAAFLAYDLAAQLLFGNFCPSQILLGLPCPGCGMTRAVFFFMTGRFARGWEMNPLGLLWIGLGLYGGFMRYWLGKRAKGFWQIGGGIAACMVVFFFYRMYRYFPGRAPIAYTEGNLLERLAPAYRDFPAWLEKALRALRP